MSETAVAKTRPDGVTILTIWYLVLAAGALFGACAAAIPLGLLSFAGDMPPDGRFFMSLLMGLGLTVSVIAGVVLGAIAWGLWNLSDWARIGAMVLGVLHLPFFPVGTAIGVATLWYMTSHPAVREAFGSAAGEAS